MTEARFWQMIDLLDWDAADHQALIEPAVKALAQMEIEEIYAFDDFLAERLHRLDGEVFARNMPRSDDGYFSLDYFLYIRCGVVANGKEYYEAILAHPEYMPEDVSELDFEPLLYIADHAYERKTGEEYDHTTTPSYETYSNKDGWP